MENTLDPNLKHKEHKDWLSTLNFYQDEIKFFQNELVMVGAAHPNLPSIIEHIEEYKSLFRNKLNLIDDLRHQIMEHEHHLAKAAGHTDLEEVHQHTEVREKMEELEMRMKKLKTNFRRFASHND